MAMDPLTAGLEFGKQVAGIIDQFVEDKDKKAEIVYQLTLKEREFSTAILTLQSTPRMDALVKFMYAWRDVGLSVVRPIGSAIGLAFVAYCTVKGIALPDWLEAVMVALFPGWMASRHLDKQAQKKVELEQERIEAQKEVAKEVGQSANPFWWQSATG